MEKEKTKVRHTVVRSAGLIGLVTGHIIDETL